MFNYNIKHQDSYSRGEAILRALFGWIYIGIPHLFLLYFVVLAFTGLNIVAFWITLFTGKLPKLYFDLFVGTNLWAYRVIASLNGLADKYPSFGFDSSKEDRVTYELEYIENYPQGQVLLVALFGWLYVGVPHGVILIFRFIWVTILKFVAFWVVLFTGNFPASWHKFIVNTYRWNERVVQYLYLVRVKYPPFNGLPDDEQDDQ